MLVRGYADSRVAHREPELDLEIRDVDGGDREHDFAGGRELDRVLDEVEQNLPEPPRIADQLIRNVLLDIDDELQPLLVRARDHPAEQRRELIAQRKLAEIELDLTRTDFREVEQAIDDYQQVLAGRLDRPEPSPLLVGQLRIERQLGHPEDRIHRRPDLVAHVRQELVLVSIGRCGALLVLAQGAKRGRAFESDRCVIRGCAEEHPLFERWKRRVDARGDQRPLPGSPSDRNARTAQLSGTERIRQRHRPFLSGLVYDRRERASDRRDFFWRAWPVRADDLVDLAGRSGLEAHVHDRNDQRVADHLGETGRELAWLELSPHRREHRQRDHVPQRASQRLGRIFRAHSCG